MKLPSRVLAQWLAFWSVEPYPEDRADLRFGLQSAHFHQTMTGEQLSIDKFLPDWEANQENKSQKELDAAIKSWEALSEEE